MNREYHRWRSSALGREMELLVFGHAGPRAFAFPTSQGRFYDWEDRGMIAALADHLEDGRLQLYCVDSVDAESWYNRAAHPADRARRHAQYDQYIAQEVLPFSVERNAQPFVIAVGASFGAYHAVNFALRHPDLVGRAIGLSGLYDIGDWTDDYSDENIYLNNPCAFLPNEHASDRLAALRGLDLILAIGRDDRNRPNNERLSAMLWDKGIWHALRIWNGWAHDWPYWQEMIRLYIGGHD
jgi:esterase/lipase superfamily enzyme